MTTDATTGANFAELFGADFLRKLERLSLISRKLRAGRMKGERRSPKRGTSVEFADYRNYAPGDDLRRVDWNAYARLERLFLKLFQEDEDVSIGATRGRSTAPIRACRGPPRPITAPTSCSTPSAPRRRSVTSPFRGWTA